MTRSCNVHEIQSLDRRYFQVFPICFFFLFFSSSLHLHSSEVETGNGQTQSVPTERSATAEMETPRPATGLLAQGVRPKSIKCNQSLPCNRDCVTMCVHHKLIVSAGPIHNGDASALTDYAYRCTVPQPGWCNNVE